jgi:hypothetical protein
MVIGGPVFYPGDRAEEVLEFWREFVKTAPDELSTVANLLTAPPAPFLPEEWHGKKLIGIVACYAGSQEDGEKAVAPLKALGDPVADLMGPLPYVALQSLLDPLWGPGAFSYMKAGYVNELGDDAISTLARFHQDATSPKSEIHLHHFGGAVARVDADANAYGERQAPFVLNAIASSFEADGFDNHVDWAQRLNAEMQPSLSDSAYINFLSSEGEDRVKAAYGEEKFGRLQALKNEWDPTNFFRLNQNIPPTVSN